MEQNKMLEVLKKLNSLDISDLDEEIAKMQMSYEQWSKLMGDKGYWSKSFSETLLEEDNEALLGKRDIGFEDFKRLSKEYGRKMVEPKKSRETIEGQIEEQTDLLQDKLFTEKKLDEHIGSISFFESCLEEEGLEQEYIDELKEKLAYSQLRMERCKEFQKAREEKSIPIQDVKDNSIGTDVNKQNDNVADFRRRLDEYRKANPVENHDYVYDSAESVALEEEAYTLGLEFDDEVKMSHGRDVEDFRRRLDEYRKANPVENHDYVYDSAESVALEEEAYTLGLEFDDEVKMSSRREIEDDIKGIEEAITNISRGEIVRDVQNVTRGLSQDVREMENPTQTMGIEK